MLRILSEKKRRSFYEENIGKEAEVLFENDVEEGRMEGFTENYIRVCTDYDPMLLNTTQRVQLTEVNDKGLMEITDATPEILSH